MTVKHEYPMKIWHLLQIQFPETYCNKIENQCKNKLEINQFVCYKVW